MLSEIGRVGEGYSKFGMDENKREELMNKFENNLMISIWTIALIIVGQAWIICSYFVLDIRQWIMLLIGVAIGFCALYLMRYLK